MKKMFNAILTGAGVCIGWTLGEAALKKLSNPVVRKGIKTRFINVKDAIFKKEES